MNKRNSVICIRLTMSCNLISSTGSSQIVLRMSSVDCSIPMSSMDYGTVGCEWELGRCF